jgi:hypothetical protein
MFVWTGLFLLIFNFIFLNEKDLINFLYVNYNQYPYKKYIDKVDY